VLSLPVGKYEAVVSARGFVGVKRSFAVPDERLVELELEPSECKVVVSVPGVSEAVVEIVGEGVREKAEYKAGKSVVFEVPRGSYKVRAYYYFKVDRKLMLVGEVDCQVSKLETPVEVRVGKVSFDSVSYLNEVREAGKDYHLKYWYEALKDIAAEEKNKHLREVLNIFAYFLKKWLDGVPLNHPREYSWEVKGELATKILEEYKSGKPIDCDIRQVYKRVGEVWLLKADELAPLSLRTLRNTIKAVQEYIDIAGVEDETTICRFLALLYDLAAAQINKPRFVPVYYVR